MNEPRILIVGAGPTGLVLALHLAHRGVLFRIVDKNKGPGLASRAMAVHARTLESYQQLGLADAIVRMGIKIETVHLREGGEEVARLTLKEMGEGLSPFPFMLSFPQDDHERFLVGKLQELGVAVEWETVLTSLVQNDARVRATLVRADREEQVEVSYLCGCDGVRSRVRDELGIGFAGGTYDHLYYVADVKLSGDTDTDATMNLGEDGFALRLPVRSSGMQRLIGIAPGSSAADHEMTFEDVRPTAEPLLGVEVAEVNWFSTYRVHHRVAARFQVTRCFLAGDAGHVHSPTGGQGMNTGIGDAVNLAWKLAEVVHGRALPALLETYEPERIAFARKLVATTDKAFQLIVSGGLGGQILRTWLLPHALPFLTGFSAARRTIFKTISQVRIAYEDSPLSGGAAGDIRGGDRLPWVPGPSGDNFAALQSMDWQLHVYGDVTSMTREAAGRMGLRLQSFDWSEAAEAAGLKRDAAYLVRPDGYVSLALPDQRLDQVSSMTSRMGLRFGTVAAWSSADAR